MIKKLLVGVMLSAAVISAPEPSFGQNNFGLPVNPPRHSVFVVDDELDTLAAGMTAGTWQKLHDDVSQTAGIGSVILPKSATNYMVLSPDYTSDWPAVAGLWNGHARPLISAWNGGALVDKTGHTRFYIPAAGGHFDGMDNGVYSFDLLAAAHAINTASRQGTEQQWVQAKAPARLVYVRDGSGNAQRPFNAKNPYNANISNPVPLPQNVRVIVVDRDDPLGDNQCNVGPPATHTYGTVQYIPDYDGILVHGAVRGGSVGSGPRGLWLFDISTQDWQLLPPDRDLTPPYDCSNATAGDMFWEWGLSGASTENVSLIYIGNDRFAFGNNRKFVRWRMDDVPYSFQARPAPNDHGQWMGNDGSHPTKTQTSHIPTEFNAVGAPYNGDLGAWTFFKDAGAGTGDMGYAYIWPQIDVDNSWNNVTFMDYINYVPNDGSDYLVDLTTGIYSATHDKFFFIHKPWRPDFKGQVYALEVVDDGGTDKLQWSTYIDPVTDPSNPGPSVDQIADANDNGTYGRFRYMENRNLFVLVYDGGGAPNYYAGQVYLLKGI